MADGRASRRARTGWCASFVLLATVLATTLTACTGDPSPGAGPASATTAGRPDSAPASTPLAATVTLRPGDGTQDVSPADPIQAVVANGTITMIALTNPQGAVVTGQLSADRRSWTASEPLGYNKVYTWAGSAAGADGRTVPIAGEFRTLSPDRQISAQLNVGDGQTYGIAMPVAVHFSAPVSDRAAVQRALTVQTSVPVTGSWAWLDSQDVHWRPQSYYPPGTSVTVAAKLYGVRFGAGAYGHADVSATFTIGRSQIVRADTRSHRMVVITNGVQIADYPASFGLDSDPGRNTHSGVHVVMSRSSTYYMSNPRYHYSDVLVHWAVRISNNGEFIHAAPWSVGQQGRTNVSHGCVNLSTANALAYYNGVLTGDPVEITGSAVPLGPSDGDYYDWTLDWAKWQAMSALPA